jgi:hypothetical protein
MLRKRTTAVVLAGMIAVSGGGVLAGSHATQAAAKHTTAAKAKPVAARKAKSRLAVRFLVTAVQDTTITAETRAGRPETIVTTPTTTFRVQGSTTPGTLTDVQAGSTIAVRGKRSGATITATIIVVTAPREAGVVTAVNGSTLTITGRNGVSHTITVTGATQYTEAGQAVTFAAIVPGSLITATGTGASGTTLTATHITIRLPQFAGRVTAVQGDIITISGAFGVAKTVVTSGATTFTAPGGAVTSLSSIMVGGRIRAQGTVNGDGQTLTALRVVVVKAAGKVATTATSSNS